MRINTVSPVNTEHRNMKNVSYGAVNQKFYKAAVDDYRALDDIGLTWMQRFRDSVNIFGKVSKKDAIDTLEAVRKFVSPINIWAFDEYFNFLYKNRT